MTRLESLYTSKKADAEKLTATLSDIINGDDVETACNKNEVNVERLKEFINSTGVTEYKKSDIREDWRTRFLVDCIGLTKVLDNFDDAFKKASVTLTDREEYVISQIYMYGKTLKEVGEDIEKSSETVRQIKMKALRKMRRHHKLFTISEEELKLEELNSENESLMTEIVRLKEENETLREYYNDLISLKLSYKNNIRLMEGKEPFKDLEEMYEAEAKLNLPLDEMGLSVRSYNCLKRSGCNTTGDILEHFKTIKDLLEVRNLGRINAREIIETMHNLGFIHWLNE